MVNGLHLYSTFIQSAVQFMPLIRPFTHTFTHQWQYPDNIQVMLIWHLSNLNLKSGLTQLLLILFTIVINIVLLIICYVI